MLLLYILWDDWPSFMISGSNQQLQQQLEYTLLKHDCHSWWISKMQSGCGDTLEERYAIEFCFKLGKNATETYGMLQTAFRPSCMNQASVFKWHKRFKEGRESVRDDERCRMSKEVRTPELIGQIKNFMDKDCRVSIETTSAQFDVSVWTVHAIIHEELKMWKICAKFIPRVPRDQKERRCHDSREMVELINSDNAPVHNSILVTDYLSKMGIKTVPHPPYSPDLAPCDFSLFPKLKGNLRGCHYETIEEMKLWRRSLTCSHKRTSMRPSRSCWNGTTSALQPEEITSKGTRISCVYYR